MEGRLSTSIGHGKKVLVSVRPMIPSSLTHLSADTSRIISRYVLNPLSLLDVYVDVLA